MKYKIETEIDPEKWNLNMFVVMRKTAIEVKKRLVEQQAKIEVEKLIKKIQKTFNNEQGSINLN